MRTRDIVYNKFTDLIEGYELDPERGYFSIILPEATLNLVTNPSLESGLATGYSAVGGTIAVTYSWQAFGAAGLILTPIALTECGVYFGSITLTAGRTYTASVVFQGDPGKSYYIGFYSSAGALLHRQKWIANGHKQRIYTSYVAASSAAHRIYVTRDGQYSDLRPFYIDGLQVEEKPYPTTFCDGDQKGFVLNELAYYWTGTPRASTSIRLASTRSGGREMNLFNYGIRLLSVIGLGMASLVDQALPIPGYGEMAQGTGTQAREFTLVGAIQSDGPRGRGLQTKRNALINAFKPDLVSKDQPLILRYQNCDEDGEATSESLDIICKYRGGLEQSWTNHHEERLFMTFKMYLPFISNTYSNGIELGYQTEVTGIEYAMERGPDGVWSGMTGLTATVTKILRGADGKIYVAGAFTDLDADVEKDYIAIWNGTAYDKITTVENNGAIWAMVEAPNGDIYIGGAFTDWEGIAGADRIAKYTPSTGVWSAVGTGMASGIILALVFDTNGILYAGGSFQDAGGDTNCNFVAKWDGSTWLPLDTGMDDNVWALAVDKNNNLIIGGEFLAAGGIVGATGVAMWNGVEFVAMGSVGANDTVRALLVDENNLVYAGGLFTSMDGVAKTERIAVWDNIKWSAVGNLQNSAFNQYVTSLYLSKDGHIYVGGIFTTLDGLTLPDRAAVLIGNNWYPLDINVNDGAAVIFAFEEGVNGTLYIGGSWSAASGYSATVITPGVAGATTYPIVTFVGPGRVWMLKNFTTGKAVYFDNLTFLPGETAVLDFNPAGVTFTSSFRGNLMPYILPGSNLDFELLPGSNNISTYIFGSTDTNTKIYMTWPVTEWGIDGAVFE